MLVKNPTSDKRPIPTFWDIVGEKPPQIRTPNRKWTAQDAANNPGIQTIDVLGDLLLQANNIKVAQVQIMQHMMRGMRPVPGFMPHGGGGGPPPGQPGPPPFRGGGAGPLPQGGLQPPDAPAGATAARRAPATWLRTPAR